MMPCDHWATPPPLLWLICCVGNLSVGDPEDIVDQCSSSDYYSNPPLSQMDPQVWNVDQENPDLELRHDAL